MRDGFSGAVVSLLIVLFVASLVALLSWFAYFLLDAAFFGRPKALGALWMTAVLSGSVALFSGLLAFHYEHEDYTEGEEVLYRTFLIIFTGILLCSGMAVALIYVFGQPT